MFFFIFQCMKWKVFNKDKSKWRYISTLGHDWINTFIHFLFCKICYGTLKVTFVLLVDIIKKIMIGWLAHWNCVNLLENTAASINIFISGLKGERNVLFCLFCSWLHMTASDLTWLGSTRSDWTKIGLVWVWLLFLIRFFQHSASMWQLDGWSSGHWRSFDCVMASVIEF